MQLSVDFARLSQVYHSLSPELQAEVNQIVRTIDYREKYEKVRGFRPFKPTDPNPHNTPCNDQESFYLSPARERWAFGSNRSGKSEMAAYDAIKFATGEHPVRSINHRPPVNIRQVVVDLEGTAEQVWLNKMQTFVKRSDLKGGSFKTAWSPSSRTLRFANGSKIYLKATSQQLNKFGGTDDDACYVDEHIPQAYYRECKARLVDRDGFFVCSMTPESGAVTWEKRHIRDRQDGSVQWWQWSMYGNPILTKAAIEEFKRSLGGDLAAERIKMWGDFAKAAGGVIPQFSEVINTMDDYRMLQLLRSTANVHGFFAIDPHMKKDAAMVWAFQTNEGDLMIYRAAKKFLTVPELKNFIRSTSASEQIQTWLGDEAMGGDGLNIWGQESVLKQLSSGVGALPIVPTSQGSDKSFEAGIMKLRSLCAQDPISQKPKLYIAKDGGRPLLDELDEYQFIPDTKADEMTFRERVRKVNDDCIDCMRYIAMAMDVATDVTVKSAMGDGW